MSYEFIAKISVASSAASTIRDAFARAGYHLISSREPGQLLLHLPDHRASPSDPEDIEIRIEADQIYVAMHSATRSERHTIITALEQTLLQLGYAARFEED